MLKIKKRNTVYEKYTVYERDFIQIFQSLMQDKMIPQQKHIASELFQYNKRLKLKRICISTSNMCMLVTKIQ